MALRLNMLANIGAYVGSDRNLLSPFGMIGTVLGVYLIPKAYINVVGVLSQHQPDRALSRRRAAGGDLPDRAADRRRGARAGCRSRRAAAQEHAAGIGPAVPEPGRAVLRLRRVREEHGHGAQARRRGGLRGAGRGVEEARQAARPRHRQCHRAGGRHGAAGICRDPLQPERHGGAADGHQEPGPGPRDDVQADPERAARHRSGRRAVHRRRHRPRRLRHGHQRLALDGAGRLGALSAPPTR